MSTAKMHRMPSQQESRFEWRNGDTFRLKFQQSIGQTLEVFSPDEDHHIAILAKLRRAVKHAGLPPHKQVADCVDRERRKDFVNRVRDQAILQPADKNATESKSPASVPAASAGTTPARSRHHPGPPAAVGCGPVVAESVVHHRAPVWEASLPGERIAGRERSAWVGSAVQKKRVN